MSERTLGRREVLAGVGAAAGAVTLAGAVASPAAADTGSGPSGSWLVTRHDNPPGDTSPVGAVVSFAAGHVLITQDINPPAAPFLGTWDAGAGGTFTGTMWSGQPGGPDPSSEPGVVLRVHIRGRHTGDSITVRYSYAVFPAGSTTPLATGTGVFRGHRIDA
jgi:hypothetical protein